eukprot:g28571.t1
MAFPLNYVSPPLHSCKLVPFLFQRERHVQSSSVQCPRRLPFSLLESPRCRSSHRRYPRSLPFPFSSQSLFTSPRSPRWHLDGVNIRCCALPQVSNMLPCSVPLKMLHYLSRGCPSGLKGLESSWWFALQVVHAQGRES